MRDIILGMICLAVGTPDWCAVFCFVLGGLRIAFAVFGCVVKSYKALKEEEKTWWEKIGKEE